MKLYSIFHPQDHQDWNTWSNDTGFSTFKPHTAFYFEPCGESIKMITKNLYMHLQKKSLQKKRKKKDPDVYL